MTQEDLLLTLDSLKKNLVDSPQLDAATTRKLQTLIHEIELSLASSSPVTDSSASQGSLTQQVQSMIADFEVHHPKLTANLSFIAERLADMGI